MNLFATAARGTEDLCAAELRALGAPDAQARSGGVAFSGDMQLGMRACLWLRTASRVLLPLGGFDAPDPDALYQGTRSVEWPSHLTPRHTIAVDATVRDSRLTHSHYVALKIKDAIVDAMRDRAGARPDVRPRDPDVRIVAHVERDRCALSLDLAGEPLHRRGYRAVQTQAPLKETLAAAIVLASGWDRARPFCDPMCGSGTIAIEAAWLAMDRAPGLGRAFGCERWPAFGESERRALRAMRDEAAARVHRPSAPVTLSDWHDKAIAAATANVRAAGLQLVPRKIDAAELEPLDPPGFIVTNPPYGERLAQKGQLQLLGFYGKLAARWSGFFGHTVVVLSGNPDLGRAFGMEPFARRELWNGPIRCELLTYRIGVASW